MDLSVAIYEFAAWGGYMLPGLLPEAVRIPANPFDSSQEILAKCPPKMNVFAFHLNCTRTARFPRCREQLISALQERGSAVLNATTTDIGKRSLQGICKYLGLPSVQTSQSDGSAADLVIVKTDLNYGGYGEKTLSPDQLAAIGERLLLSPIKSFNDYRVLPRSDIPPEWWSDPSLVIERFIANRRDRKFRVYFAGTHYFVSIWTDENRIKKYRTGQLREEYLTCERTLALAEHPKLHSSLQIGTTRLLQHLRMDFGALDLVEDDFGVCYIVDLNATSYARAIHPEARDHLRTGLCSRVAELELRYCV